MAVLAVMLSAVGAILVITGATMLVAQTRRLRSAQQPDPGLAGSRGSALALALVGLLVTGLALALYR
jgi:hypothetical protein